MKKIVAGIMTWIAMATINIMGVYMYVFLYDYKIRLYDMIEIPVIATLFAIIVILGFDRKEELPKEEK